MSFCRFGNKILPEFYIYPAADHVLVVIANNVYHELNRAQVRFLHEILISWIKEEFQKRSFRTNPENSSISDWVIRPKKDRDILAVEIPSNRVELNFCQAFRLVSALKGWLLKQQKGDSNGQGILSGCFQEKRAAEK